MQTPALKLPYPRPTSLTDPFHDHSPEHCARLISTPDKQLTWHDLQCLLGPHLPAGTYEESAYFLPLAFDYILANDEHAHDLETSLIWFASEYSAQLQLDGVLDDARLTIECCLDHWTSEFVINHLFLDSAIENDRTRDYRDLVRNSETVMDATKDLVQFKAHEDLAVSFFVRLADNRSDPVKSAWFLECVRAYLSRDVCRPPRHPEIQQLLDNEQLGIEHSQIVRDKLPDYEPELTYWQNTFTLLGTIGSA